MACSPTQEGHLHFLDFRAALERLAPDHREALILIGASGHSYEEAAARCGCAVGTMRSRVNRARVRLAEFLAVPKYYRRQDMVWIAAIDAFWRCGPLPSIEA